ncbi:methylamine utilization protein [Lacimicrobium sp. SS2-24]|uniref:methylamine utilization protein n=1 Tax=Lacimicrobium sp. SS2-24 TaxID=2005569 RepID=UPI001FEE94A7|nr:methylamine utilization protein [Lacimicrobium sp. SS2-24]
MLKRCLCILSCLLSLPALATELAVTVLTEDGKPMPGAVIYLTSEQALPGVEEGAVATMDQVNKQFAPHILVVQKGTQVSFPNSDSIQHHVYSFSAAKTFQLQLYKDNNPAPLPFDAEGKVELGCNVHDWMLGYIYVVDTPYFGQTNKKGQLSLNIADGDYRLHIRHPRIEEASANLDRNLSIHADEQVAIQLKQPLLPGLNEFEDDTDEFIGYE